MDPDVLLVAWRRTDEGAGHSMGRVARRDGGWTCTGTEVLAGPPTVLACAFRVELDTGWTTRELTAWTLEHAGERRLSLVVDSDRRWSRDGVPAPELDGCVDVDVAATPLTNTFPISRHAQLPVGDSVTTPVAWVEVPSLRVLHVEQTYRRLSRSRWEYSDPQHGAFELSVDEHGLVVEYTGFAVRVAP